MAPSNKQLHNTKLSQTHIRIYKHIYTHMYVQAQCNSNCQCCWWCEDSMVCVCVWIDLKLKCLLLSILLHIVALGSNILQALLTLSQAILTSLLMHICMYVCECSSVFSKTVLHSFGFPTKMCACVCVCLFMCLQCNFDLASKC